MIVSEIMNKSVITVGEDTTIREMFFLMQKSGSSAFPVVNSANELVGMVSEEDTLKIVYPDFSKFTDGEFPDFEDIRERVVESYRMRVSEIMKREVLAAYPETPVLRIGIKMLVNKIHMAPVLENKKVVGVVTDNMVFVEIMKKGLSGQVPYGAAAKIQPQQAALREAPAPEKVLKLPKTQSGPEKRIHRRLDLKIPARYHAMNQKDLTLAGNEQLTETIDISAGGLSLKTFQKFALGDLMNVKIQISPLHPLIECMVRVCRSEPHPEGNYQVGLLFLALSSKERSDIDKYIQKNG